MSVCCLISGGVDSAVAVHMLCEQCVRPDLYYIKIGDGPEGEWNCTAEEDWEMASAVARRYGLHLELIDLQRDYWERVVGYVVERLRQGLTPNSDVMCNKLIKFGCFEERAGKDYDRIATGHYARTEQDEAGRTWLCTSPDAVKDQTDFLAQLDGHVIRKAMFPIGTLPKEEVRRLAEEHHLAPAHRRDSQGICFLGKVQFAELARRYLGERKGIVVERETGNVIGSHNGYWFYTIGQRKGLGFGGGPWYVVKKDIRRNIIYVSRGFQTQAAYTTRIPLADPNFITINPFPDDGEYDLTFKVRHTPDFTPGKLLVRGAHYTVHAAAPVQGVAPGQFCTLYDISHHRCFGSAEIQSL